MTSGFSFHWAQRGVSVAALDTLIDKASFGSVDYVYILENNSIRAYISMNGLKEYAMSGDRLREAEFLTQIKSQSARIADMLDHYQIPNVALENAVEKWNILVRAYVDVWKVYIYCEEYALRSFEEFLQKRFLPEQLFDFFSQSNLSPSVDEESLYAIDVLRSLGDIKLRLHTKAEVLIKTERVFAEYICEKTGLSQDEVFLLTTGEIRNILDEKEPDRTTIAARSKGCALIRDKETWKWVTGDEFREWKDIVEADEPQEIRGMPAFKGKAKGAVCKHLSWTDTTEVPPGAILVTGMTNPQMVPFLKNAAAIVTDEGGLTCHAAIISREMKIPCIVGTRVGTKHLKDGDMIEVDANAGIVRKI